MRGIKFKSLTMRIWTTFTIIILIIICSISLLYTVIFRQMSQKAKMQDLKAAHSSIVNNMMDNNENYNEPIKFDQFKNLHDIGHFKVKISEGGSAQIVDLGKTQNVPPMMKGGTPPQPDDSAMKKWISSFIKDGSKETQYIKKYNNTTVLFISSPVTSSNSEETYFVSYIPDKTDNSLFYSILLIGIVFIAIGFVTAKIVAQRISKPLSELEKFTLRIAKKDWKEPIEVKSEDEIGRLARSMNHMQRELKRADEEEKMFLQSISHDLKTPVMVIMSHAEAIKEGVYIDSVEKTAEIIRDEAVSLEKKIKQLLYLNTLDYVLENNTQNEDIDLKELMQNMVGRFEVVNSMIDWELFMDRVITVGNRDKICVSIENVLENGLRYAKETVRISLKKVDGFAELDIFNDGPLIDEIHLGHIFENLYKDKTGNFGLGLTISKKIIEFYGGEIKVANREDGVSFIIKYPIKADS